MRDKSIAMVKTEVCQSHTTDMNFLGLWKGVDENKDQTFTEAQ